MSYSDRKFLVCLLAYWGLGWALLKLVGVQDPAGWLVGGMFIITACMIIVCIGYFIWSGLWRR